MYIIKNQNTTLGMYGGNTAEEALDALARDAGYADHDAACEVSCIDPGDWTESRKAFSRGTISLLVEYHDGEYSEDE